MGVSFLSGSSKWRNVSTLFTGKVSNNFLLTLKFQVLLWSLFRSQLWSHFVVKKKFSAPIFVAKKIFNVLAMFRFWGSVHVQVRGLQETGLCVLPYQGLFLCFLGFVGSVNVEVRGLQNPDFFCYRTKGCTGLFLCFLLVLFMFRNSGLQPKQGAFWKPMPVWVVKVPDSFPHAEVCHPRLLGFTQRPPVPALREPQHEAAVPASQKPKDTGGERNESDFHAFRLPFCFPLCPRIRLLFHPFAQEYVLPSNSPFLNQVVLFGVSFGALVLFIFRLGGCKKQSAFCKPIARVAMFLLFAFVPKNACVFVHPFA